MVLAALLQFAVAAAVPASPPGCDAPAYRQLDFWVGDWTLEYDLPDGSIGTATNSIRLEYGDCAVVERFAMPNGYAGSSYSIYDRGKATWRQMWVDNQGGVFVLEGGPVEGPAHRFELRTLEPVGPDRRFRRMIWDEVSADRLVWHWQSLGDDGQWTDQWVLRYRRAPGG